MKPTKYVYVHIVQGNYGFGEGWEDLCASLSWKESKENLKEHRENEPQYRHRRIVRRVTREKFEVGDF